VFGIVVTEHVERQKPERLRQHFQDAGLGAASGVSRIAYEVRVIL
jgi:hypothetical protein